MLERQTQSTLMSPSSAEVGRRVRAARTYAGLSIPELADALGLGVTTIKRIEAGDRSARRYEIWAVAEACDLPRAFFEVEFEALAEHAVVTTGMLRRIEARLARVESRLEAELPTAAA